MGSSAFNLFRLVTAGEPLNLFFIYRCYSHFELPLDQRRHVGDTALCKLDESIGVSALHQAVVLVHQLEDFGGLTMGETGLSGEIHLLRMGR